MRSSASHPRSDAAPSLDERVATIASRQHGTVHRAQLRALGMAARTIDDWVARGRLIRLHAGVYAVGHTALPPLGRLCAAVLACGDADPVVNPRPRAAAGGRSAGAPHRLLDPWSGRPFVVSERRVKPRGVEVSTIRRLLPEDVVVVDSIPTTTWARTLVDLGIVLPGYQLARALERSVIHELYDHPTLLATMGRADGHQGLGPLRRAIALGHHLDPQTCDSVIEELFLQLVREAAPPLPVLPEMQGWVTLTRGERFRVDALYRALRIALELDSRWHDPAGPRMRDGARDAALRRDGYLTFRSRWADLTGRPGWVLWVVRGLVDRRLREGVAPERG